MTVIELLRKLEAQKIKLWVENGSLKFRAPKGALTPQLKQSIGQHKPKILDLLGNVKASSKASHSIPKVAREGELPLSFSQRRLWFIDQLQPGASVYNIPYAIRLKGALDIAAFEKAIAYLIQRHEVLRTRFPAENGLPKQIIEEDANFKVATVDLTDLQGETQEARVLELALEESHKPFSIAELPLLRVTFLVLGQEEHVMLLTFHHIISDGWSLGVFVRELVEATAYLQQGAEPELAPLPIQYADFSVWQEKELSGERLEDMLKYWRDHLGDVPPPLELPTDHRRPAKTSFKGAIHPFHLSSALTKQLKAYSQKHNATLFMVLLAGYKYLLRRFASQEEIVVGTPIANRNLEEIQNLIGFFVNTLVLRTDITDDLSFEVLTKKVQETVLGAQANQDLPFDKLVEELHPDRDLNRNPLFQVAFSVNVESRPTEAGNGLVVEPLLYDRGEAHFDLNLTFSEAKVDGQDVLKGSWNYSSDLFEVSTMERLSQHLTALLEWAMQHATVPLAQMSLISATEQQQLLTEFNGAFEPYERHENMQALFEAAAERDGQAIATEYGEQIQNYSELNTLANRIAHFLRSKGVTLGTPVGIYLDRSPLMVAATLGIIKAGGAYVPLDPEAPMDRTTYIIEDASLTWALTSSKLAEDLANHNQIQLLKIDDVEALDAQPHENPTNVNTPNAMAYIMYTSGSTGKPKGTVIPHRAVVRLVRNTNFFDFKPGCRILQVATVVFDAATMELWGPLLNGGTVVGIDKDTYVNSARFRDALAKAKIDCMFITTALFNQHIRNFADTFKTVGTLLVGGEALNPDTVATCLKKGAPKVLSNAYGPTENTTFTTHFPFSDGVPDPLPIGKAINATSTFVLDRLFNLVPLGTPGELCTGGDGLAQGYHLRPELTAEKFIPNAYSGMAGSRLYRTGDLVRFDDAGDILFIGRIDFQVKVRGFRIELGEIETVIRQNQSIKDTVVLAREDKPGEKRLVAYLLVPEANDDKIKKDTIDATRKLLKAQLPGYMMPSAFVIMDAFPLNNNGKVDRRALPAPERTREELSAGYVAPRNGIEEEIVNLWMEVLELDRVGVHDNFFDLGGHSLLATQVTSRIRQIFSVDMPIRVMFENATVAELAEIIEEQQGEDVVARHIPPLVPISRDTPPPLSFSQQRLWFIDQIEPDSPAYNISSATKIVGPIEVEVLETALSKIIERHEPLRTRFASWDGRPVQIIDPAKPTTLEVVDLQHVSVEAREKKALDLAVAEGGIPFKLAEGHLIRIKLLRLAPQEHVLLLTLHHIIADGWSTGVLVRELGIFIDALKRDSEPDLPPLEIQYADYAHWQREYLKESELDRQINFWKGQLDGAPQLLEMPFDRKRPAVQNYHGGLHTFKISKSLTKRLHEFSRKNNATMFMTLFSLWKVLLYRYSGQQDILCGTPIANRNFAETEALIGFFVNTLVLRTDLSGEPSFIELVKRVQQRTLGAYSHQDLPFERLVEEMDPERNLSHNPLVQVNFILQNFPRPEMGDDDIRVEPMELQIDRTHYDLALILEEKEWAEDHGIFGAFNFSTALWDRATIERITKHFVGLLEAAINQPETPISKLPMMTDDERHRVVRGWNYTAKEFPHQETLATLFEKAAMANPERTALVFESPNDPDNVNRISYGALNSRANKIAHFLRTKGVGPETFVGIFMPRCLDQIASLWGILKAGGAYVPLDPEDPEGRLEYVIGDTKPALTIATRDVSGFLAERGLAHISLDDTFFSDRIDAMPDENLPQIASAENLPYVIYTSGSTGNPKGIIGHHRGVLNFYKAQKDMIYDRYAGPLNVTMNARLSFDASVKQLVQFLDGHTLHLIAEETRRDGKATVDYLRRHQVNVMEGTPSQLKILLDGGFLEADGLAMRAFVLAGEALDDLWARLAAHPTIEFFNLYGPTEATIDSTGTLVDANVGAHIGTPIDNQRCYIVDRHFRPQPIGIPGELCIAGVGLARGYLNRPELTAQVFVPDPFGEVPGSRLYRTGDLTRFLRDGRIQYMGRIDFQVKLRGYRIELGEIENCMAQYPGVKGQHALVREDQPSDKRLVGYIVPEEGETLDLNALRKFLAKDLPEYMIPSAFVLLDKFPLNANGKVDRKKLPEPDRASLDLAEFEEARSPLEEELAGIMAGVLSVDKVGIRDNFFKLGGHSLLAMQVTARVRVSFGKDIPLRSFFENPTVLGLVEALKQEGIEASGEAETSIEIIDRDGHIPLSFSQQRLWFIDQLEPENLAYNISKGMRFVGPFDADKFEEAINVLVARHETLRTRFEETKGVPSQVIAEPQPISIPRISLTQYEGAALDAERQKIIDEELQKPFNLKTGPLFRVTLMQERVDSWVVIISMHHIISDGWSLGVLMRDIGAAFGQLMNGAPEVALEPLPIQYADYAAWQRDWLSGETLERQLNYWKSHLGSNPPVLDMPTDFTRPPVQSFAGSRVMFSLPDELSPKVKAFCRENEVTMFMLLMAAYKILLYRYSGQTDLVVGTPIANRRRPEVENLIGFFVNNLVLRSDLSDSPSFYDVVKSVQENALDAYSHQDLPFEMLVDALELERDMSRNPLFQVMFMMQNLPRGKQASGKLTVETLDIDPGVTHQDLILAMWEEDNGALGGVLNYSSDLFRESTIRRMIGHLQTIIEAIVEDDTRAIGSVSLLSKDESVEVLEAWNATQKNYPLDKAVHHLFEERAAQTPDAPAAKFEIASLSYAGLNKATNRLAHHLMSLGVGPEVRVGVCMDRSMNMLISLLAVLKAGGTYVPIDPNYPRDRVTYVLEDAEIKTILTETNLLDLVENEGVQPICMDRDRAKWAKLSDQNPVVPTFSTHNLAYIIYTSGSTGKPKGVQIPHRALTNFELTMAEKPGYTADDYLLALTTISFDIAGLEMYLPLISGGTVEVLPDEIGKDPIHLKKHIASSGATVVQATPATWNMLLATGWEGNQNLKILCGGEAFPEKLAAELQDKVGEVWNMYGPTETTIWSSVWHVASKGKVSIGKPIANTEIYLVDSAANAVPVGIPGELLIGGDGLARGYWNRPDLTAERFIPNPFSKEPGARLYRTGDLARYLPDGNIECLGRIDHQVKVRGFRIELGEIETVMAQSKAVEKTVVVAKEDKGGDKRLVGYVEHAEGAEITIDELRELCRQSLPEYMVPSDFMVLDEFPLTPNGKIDRKALPEPERQRVVSTAMFVEARDSIEETLVNIYSEVLGVEKVGIHDSFFELGGHSLLATQVISRLREIFEVDLALRALFTNPTIEGLAEAVKEAQDSGRKIAPPIVAVERDNNAVPLSFAQQRLWFIDQLEPENPAYNITSGLRLQGPFDPAVFLTAIRQVIERHETLRTSFSERDGEAVQVIHDKFEFDMPIVDLSHLGTAAREAEMLRHAKDEARKPFKLTEAPLMRITLLKMADQDHAMFISMHHIISDGWSIGILIGEIYAHYEAVLNDTPVELAPLPVQYADFAVWQRNWLSGEELDRQLNYWKGQLGDANMQLELPTDKPRPDIQTFVGAFEPIQFSPELSAKLKTLSNNEGVTLYMTLMAAFGLLLSRYSGQDDVLIGTPVANRHRREIESLIGFFINTLVIRSNLDGNPTFKEVLQRMQKTTLDAYAHQDFPFERLVEELQPERNLNRNAIIQTNFVYMNLPKPQAQDSDLKVNSIPQDRDVTHYDLALTLGEKHVEVDGQKQIALAGSFNYNVDLFETATIRRMIAHLETLLWWAVEHNTKPISEASLLTDQERQQLLVSWNQTQVNYPAHRTIHELFEERAAKHPDRTALADPNTSMTYAMLNQRANQLAHHLREHYAVGPDVLVGICMARSLENIVALLAILKAGGGYVPMDEKHPTERLALIAKDASMPVILSKAEHADDMPHDAVKVLYLDGAADQTPGGLWAEVASQPTTNPHVTGLTRNHLAYAIYTSGSTGMPKGVMLEHAQVLNYTLGATKRLAVEEGLSYALVSTFAADLGNTSIFGSFILGGTLHILPAEISASAEEMETYVSKNEIDVIKIVPTHLRALIQGEKPKKVLPAKILVMGGEACTAELVAKVQELGVSERLYNHYGPSEATVGVTAYPIMHKVNHGDGVVPLGRPFGNIQLFVLDAVQNLLPVGLPGELCIAGDSLARGYLNRPDQTAERFIPNPYSGKAGSRMYRTGDLVRYLPDGNVVFIGRIDHQIKIRGYRIELGEIEAAISSFSDVTGAVVMAKEDDFGEKRVVAYVEAAEHATDEAKLVAFRDALKANLSEQLPEYMVPAALVILERIPLTANGKIDRRSLPTPNWSASLGSGEQAKPRDHVEERLHDLWCDILKLESIGIHDSFFELGGHSLLATQVISRIRRDFEVNFPLPAFFKNPTLAGVAEVIRGLDGHALEVKTNAPQLVSVDRQERMQLSFAQQRLWFIYLLDPKSPGYNIPYAVRLDFEMEEAQLREALTAVINRHETLRTLFGSHEGEGYQTILDSIDVPLRVEDLSNIADEEERLEKARTLAMMESREPFDLEHGPLLRTVLVKMGDGRDVLLFTMHHIISDGWSMGILYRDIGAHYRAAMEGSEPKLPPMDLQYADFAAWQQKWLSGEVLQQQIDYWKNTLGGAPVLELPADKPRPKVLRHEGERVNFELSQDLSNRINDFTKAQGATMFMTLLSAFKVLLAQYSGQRDIVVGTPIANRTRAELEGMVGFFVNTLVLRTELEGSPSFIEIVKRVKEGSTEAFGHQDLPFERLVDELGLERDLSRNPLFQVMFSMANTASVSGAREGSTGMSSLGLDHGLTHFDLTLAMGELSSKRGVLQGTFNYNTALFERQTVQRMVDNFVSLLDMLMRHGTSNVFALPMLRGVERDRLLVGANLTDADLGHAVPFHTLLDHNLAAWGDQTAIRWRDRNLSFQELDAAANRLANHLIEQGLKPDQAVAVYMHRIPEMVVGLLAILRAGGAYLPLDPSHPADRIAYMLNDAKPSLVMVQSDLVDKLPKTACKKLIAKPDWSGIQAADTAPNVTIHPENLAYIIYTSGSTGNPKGTLVHHGGVTNYVRWAQDAYGATQGSGSLVQSPIGFDLTVTSLWLPLLSGTPITLIPESEGLDELIATLRHSKELSLLKLTPSHLDVLRHRLDPKVINGMVHTVVLGGEALHASQLAWWHEAAPNTRFINEYGPTEAVVGCVIHEDDGNAEGPVPIGKPIANMRIYALNQALEPVPRGVVGEVYLAGVGVVRGYLNRADLTADRFIPDPFSDVPGARLYRTGDLARIDGDNRWTYVGRIDEQVKLRGYRIELGEIQAALLNLDAVSEALVVVDGKGTANAKLVAYYVLEDDQELSEQDLQKQLRSHLPSYMVPSDFVALDGFPLTNNGKIDRKALPAPAKRRTLETQTKEEPRNPLETELCAIWADMLNMESVGIHDNFFELGGHSLLTARVAARLQQNYGVEVPLRTFFEHPTVSQLAEQVEMILAQAPASDAPPMVKVDRDQDLPLSFSQQRLWFIDQLQPGNPAYNISSGMRLEGDFDPDIFEQAVRAVIQRHEVLRTTFGTSEGQPIQVIHETMAFDLERIDCRDKNEKELEEVIERTARREALTPFDLAGGPLMRAAVLIVGDEDHILFLSTHHIISDGWSSGIFMGEVSRFYEILVQGFDLQIPELAIQYADFSAWQRQYLSGEELERQLGYWKQQLGEPTTLNLPTDRPRPAVQTFRGERFRFYLDAELSADIKAFTRKEGASLFMVLMAAFKLLLMRYSGQSDILVGTPIAGRSRMETEELIGFFVNTLVMRTDLADVANFREAVKSVRGMALDAYAHQDLPFEKLVDELQLKRDLSRNPLFQVMFSYQNLPPQEGNDGGFKISSINMEEKAEHFDLTLAMGESPVKKGQLTGNASFNSDLFDKATIERMIGHFKVLLREVISAPEKPLTDITFITDDERRKLLVDWNDTDSNFRRDLCVQQWFEEQVEKTPDAIAVRAGNQELSFQQLNATANGLAMQLRKQGVGPDVPVGIFMERSLEMMIAVWGIIKAGGAYLPLDPSYPEDRTQFMVSDAGAKLVLTHAATQEHLPEVSADVQLLDVDSIEAQAENPALLTMSANLVYIIYTSGSTGRPKGTLIHHRGLINYLEWAIGAYRANNGVGAPVHSSLSFDLTVTGIYPALLTGHRVDMLPDDVGVEALVTALAEGGDYSVVKLTPSHLNLINRSLVSDQAANRTGAFVIGGENLTGETLRFWQENAPNTLLINEYGPTETVVGCCIYDVPADERRTGSVPIGRPIANTQLYVLDAKLQPVPVGVAGELYIAGEGVARGYLARPDLTAERFVANPFTGKAGTRMYKTGDLVRYRADGNLEFLGRIDHQVKIRGYRIELEEIESVINGHDAVEEAVVLARSAVAGGDDILVAYVVGKEGEIDAGTMNRYLRERLPDYMVPTSIMPMESIPLTSNGKVDRKALPMPKVGRDALDVEFVAPRNELEEQLAQMWSELIGIEKVGIHDNFFHIGGHSLLATQVVSRVRDNLDVDMPLRRIFENPTIADLSEVIKGLQWAKEEQEALVSEAPEGEDWDEEVI